MALSTNPVGGRARTKTPASWVPVGQHSDHSKGGSSSEVNPLLLSSCDVGLHTIFLAFLKAQHSSISMFAPLSVLNLMNQQFTKTNF